MRWLGVTLGLLSACVGLVAWIYLRDRDTANWRLPERQLATADAARTLAAFDGADCGQRCTVKLVGHIDSHHWLVRITVQGRSQCLQLDLATFATDQRHGLTGVQPSRCAELTPLQSPPPRHRG
jgi:hypothetical protein